MGGEVCDVPNWQGIPLDQQEDSQPREEKKNVQKL